VAPSNQSRISQPAYLALWQSGELARRVERALGKLADCTLCPRDCHVDRLADKFSVCRVGRRAPVSSYFPHFGEEDCLRGWRGSGTIFFAGCNLRCVFCQNFETSWKVEGELASPRKLALMMLDLQERGCHNINFVTPEHVVPQILEGLLIAVEEGLRLPLVYNTSAYDSLDSLELMEGLIDIYMPDFKFWDAEMSRRYVRAPPTAGYRVYPRSSPASPGDAGSARAAQGHFRRHAAPPLAHASLLLPDAPRRDSHAPTGI